jgi:hypothetical protein
MGDVPSGLTERQAKWFATVKANFEAKTGKTMQEWVAIARTCPHGKPRARTQWLKENYGLGVNHASYVLSEAFPSTEPGGWDDPEPLRKALWSDAASRAIFEAVEKAAAELPDIVTGQRKAFTAFSRKFQFASVKPLKGGAAALGLAVAPEASPRLSAPKNEGWSERLKSVTRLSSPAEVDGELKALLRKSWEAS